MDEKLQIVARRLGGEPMSDLCREFGISRKTGYKIFDRYLKYSQLESEIAFSLETTDDNIRIRVWNSKTSIPSVERAHLFERFYRGVEARKWAPGSGLGLYVARKIAAAHRGDVALEESTNTGGTSFRFTIPISIGEPEHDTES